MIEATEKTIINKCSQLIKKKKTADIEVCIYGKKIHQSIYRDFVYTIALLLPLSCWFLIMIKYCAIVK